MYSRLSVCLEVCKIIQQLNYLLLADVLDEQSEKNKSGSRCECQDGNQLESIDSDSIIDPIIDVI